MARRSIDGVGCRRSVPGHAVQLAAEALKGIAIVIDRIGSRKQLARLREQDDYTAHDQTSRCDVNITRRDGDALGAQMVNHLARTVNDVLHGQADPFAKVG